MRDRHGTPFEHNSMTFFVSAPIFVFREFMRHRVGWSYNEESRPLPGAASRSSTCPAPERKLVQEGRPGKYVFVEGTAEQHELVEPRRWRTSYRQAYDAYQEMLAAGVAREVARAVLPVGLFSSMYATCNARSLMHFLVACAPSTSTRPFPSFPQREIEMVGEKMEPPGPRSCRSPTPPSTPTAASPPKARYGPMGTDEPMAY